MDLWMYGQTDGWKDKWMGDGRVAGWADEWSPGMSQVETKRQDRKGGSHGKE